MIYVCMHPYLIHKHLNVKDLADHLHRNDIVPPAASCHDIGWLQLG